jgi:predicted alpha-1,2-mannosidase
MQGLIDLLGGRTAFGKKLDQFFTHEAKEEAIQDLTGAIGQYAHGNEPSHHIAYLYCYAGEPWKTQQRVRQIREQLYNNGVEGVCGNEDCGQMSAWYVFSALGLYPVNPVQCTYVLTTPEFDQARINLSNGKKFSVLSDSVHPYIKSVSLNGHDLPRVYLTHDELMGGGTMKFVTGDKTGAKWGTGKGDVPPSMTKI